MASEQRAVRFSDSVEVVSMDQDNNTSEQSMVTSNRHSENESTDSTNRSAWNPSEISFFAQQQLPLQTIDLAPRQPHRSLDSILNDAINTCEALNGISPCDDERIAINALPQRIPSRFARLDRSLFSLGTDSSFPPPSPLRNTSCLVSQALAEIMR